MASNEYCFVAHCTFHCTTQVTHQLLSNDSWFIWLFLLICYIHHVKMQLNDVIKSIGQYQAFVVLPIQTNIAKNSTDTDTRIGICASLLSMSLKQKLELIKPLVQLTQCNQQELVNSTLCLSQLISFALLSSTLELDLHRTHSYDLQNV